MNGRTSLKFLFFKNLVWILVSVNSRVIRLTKFWTFLQSALFDSFNCPLLTAIELQKTLNMGRPTTFISKLQLWQDFWTNCSVVLLTAQKFYSSSQKNCQKFFGFHWVFIWSLDSKWSCKCWVNATQNFKYSLEMEIFGHLATVEFNSPGQFYPAKHK